MFLFGSYIIQTVYRSIYFRNKTHICKIQAKYPVNQYFVMLTLVKYQKDRVKSSFNLYDQANKRIWWMPRQLEAMKDVVVCDKLGGAGKQALYPEMSEWGNPTLLGLSAPEYIGCRS